MLWINHSMSTRIVWKKKKTSVYILPYYIGNINYNFKRIIRPTIIRWTNDLGTNCLIKKCTWGWNILFYYYRLYRLFKSRKSACRNPLELQNFKMKISIFDQMIFNKMMCIMRTFNSCTCSKYSYHYYVSWTL